MKSHRTGPLNVHLFSCLLALALAQFVSATPLHADERRLPPEGDALASATATVKDAFRAELAKEKPQELAAVAKKIFTLADAEQDLSLRYAMLMEARDTAVRAEDVDLTFDILRRLDSQFRIDLASQRVDMLLALAKSAKAPDDHRRLIEQNLATIDELIAAGEFETAERQLRVADISIPKAKEVTLRKQVIDARVQVNTFKRESHLFSIAQSKLLEMPDDLDANLAAGKFLCFFKGDWDRGLVHLLKGRDEALAAAAKSDLAKPGDAAAQATTAALWWDSSEKLSQSQWAGNAVQSRAAHWYAMAAPSLTGLAKSVAEKRIEVVSKNTAIAGMSAGGHRPINLILGASGDRDSITGRWSVENGQIIAPANNWARFGFNYKLEANEFDITIEFTRHNGNEGFGIFVKPDGKPVHFGMGSLGNQYISVGDFKGEQPKNMRLVRVAIGPNGKRQVAKFQIRKGSLTTWLNGKQVLHYKTDWSELGPQDWGFKDASIGLLSWYNSITFHRVELQVINSK